MDAQQQQNALATARKIQQPSNTSLHTGKQTCFACNHLNDLEALYCEECGQALKASECKQCGSITEPGDDICERCGTWQLAGQCMFCYAPLEDDDVFCSECGNPVEGVICPLCGNRGCFDYCAHCSIPLTDTAKQMLQEAAEDPKIKEFALLIEKLSNNAPYTNTSRSTSILDTDCLNKSVNSSKKGEMTALENYLVSVRKQQSPEETKTVTVSLFSQEQKESINSLNDEILKEEERKRVEAERQMELLNNLLQSLSDKDFQTSQDARRFFGTIKASVSKEALNKLNNCELIWKCNAYNRWHPNETHCAKPHMGGSWLFVPGPIEWK